MFSLGYDSEGHEGTVYVKLLHVFCTDLWERRKTGKVKKWEYGRKKHIEKNKWIWAC